MSRRYLFRWSGGFAGCFTSTDVFDRPFHTVRRGFHCFANRGVFLSPFVGPKDLYLLRQQKCFLEAVLMARKTCGGFTNRGVFITLLFHWSRGFSVAFYWSERFTFSVSSVQENFLLQCVDIVYSITVAGKGKGRAGERRTQLFSPRVHASREAK